MGFVLVSSSVVMKISIPIPVPVGAFVVLLIGRSVMWAIEAAGKRTERSLEGLLGTIGVITVVLAAIIGIAEVAGTGGSSRIVIAAIISFAVGGLVAWGGMVLLRRYGKESTSWRFIPLFLGLVVALVMIATA